MDVKSLTQNAATHRRAFDVPTWTTIPPRTRPARLPSFGGFPQGKIAGRPLAARSTPTLSLLIIRRAVAQAPIFRVFGDIEENIPLALVSKPLYNKLFDKGDDFANAVGRPGHSIDLIDSQCLQIRRVIGRHLSGQLKHRNPFLSGPNDQFVVDICDVDHPGDLVSTVG